MSATLERLDVIFPLRVLWVTEMAVVSIGAWLGLLKTVKFPNLVENSGTLWTVLFPLTLV